MSAICKAYPCDVLDDRWALVAPYLTVVREDAGLRKQPLQEVFAGAALWVNSLRYVVKTDAPWAAAYPACPALVLSGLLRATVAEDLYAVLRLAAGREADPSTAILTGARYAWR